MFLFMSIQENRIQLIGKKLLDGMNTYNVVLEEQGLIVASYGKTQNGLGPLAANYTYIAAISNIVPILFK